MYQEKEKLPLIYTFKFSDKPRHMYEFTQELKKRKNYNKKDKEKLTSYTPIYETLQSPHDLIAQAGLYRLTMPDGMMYIGHSCDINDRINNHIISLMTSRNGYGKWYGIAAKQFPIVDNLYDFYKSIFYSMKVEVQYLRDEQEAIKLEKYELERIFLNNEMNKYYNTEYFERDEKGKFKVKRYTNPI